MSLIHRICGRVDSSSMGVGVGSGVGLITGLTPEARYVDHSFSWLSTSSLSTAFIISGENTSGSPSTTSIKVFSSAREKGINPASIRERT